MAYFMHQRIIYQYKKNRLDQVYLENGKDGVIDLLPNILCIDPALRMWMDYLKSVGSAYVVTEYLTGEGMRCKLWKERRA